MKHFKIQHPSPGPQLSPEAEVTKINFDENQRLVTNVDFSQILDFIVP
jgi:hypothetical protein